MPITKSGRYSMNPAYAEALDLAEELGRHVQDAKDGKDGDASEDGENGAQQKGPVKRIEIEPAENGGFVSRTHREQSESAGGENHDGWAPPYDEPELRAHPDGAHLMRFLGRELAK